MHLNDVDRVHDLVEEAISLLYGVVEDTDKGKFDWAQIALDSAMTALGKVSELLEGMDE